MMLTLRILAACRRTALMAAITAGVVTTLPVASSTGGLIALGNMNRVFVAENASDSNPENASENG